MLKLPHYLGLLTCALFLVPNSYSKQQVNLSSEFQPALYLRDYDLSERFIDETKRSRSLLIFLKNAKDQLYRVQRAYLLFVYSLCESTRYLLEGILKENYDHPIEGIENSNSKVLLCDLILNDINKYLNLDASGLGFNGGIPQESWDIDLMISKEIQKETKTKDENDQKLRFVCILFSLGAIPNQQALEFLEKSNNPTSLKILEVYKTLKSWNFEDIVKNPVVYLSEESFFESVPYKNSLGAPRLKKQFYSGENRQEYSGADNNKNGSVYPQDSYRNHQESSPRNQGARTESSRNSHAREGNSRNDHVNDRRREDSYRNHQESSPRNQNVRTESSRNSRAREGNSRNDHVNDREGRNNSRRRDSFAQGNRQRQSSNSYHENLNVTIDGVNIPVRKNIAINDSYVRGASPSDSKIIVRIDDKDIPVEKNIRIDILER